MRAHRALAEVRREAGADWLEEVAQAFSDEMKYHFDVEEKVLFPAAEKHEPLAPVVKRLRSEHGILRGFFKRAERKTLDESGLRTFLETLSQHVRVEERELFEGMQAAMSAEQLSALGRALDEYFAASGMPPQLCPIRTAEDGVTTAADDAAGKNPR